MLILGIESTCDETAAAVVADGTRVLSNVVASQVELHAAYRGVVPEIASRAHIENILPVIEEATKSVGVGFADIDAIAVAHRPGLIGSLLIGVTAAKTLAWYLNKPLIGVDHVHAHLYSVCLQSTFPSPGTPGEGEGGGLRIQNGNEERKPPPHPSPGVPEEGEIPGEILMPAIGLVASGGHTALYLMHNFLDLDLIGSTIDDAVGEAFDKVAAILGLGYPGGPIIDRLSETGNPKAIAFPRSRLGRDSLDFSFSGLKTSVLYFVRGFQGKERQIGELNPGQIANVAASFQEACVDILLEKLHRAVRKYDARSIIIGGGVSANRGLRNAMENFGVPFFFPPMQYCTDNAAMTAGLAHHLLKAGQTSKLDLDAIPYSQFLDATH
ncbi:MAG: tRNA (adenosine(37)-N6)-threonylcarbamoyltransferase complex transferase subunit TsaD [Tepidisphaeraceae bacterium]|jgi:N6-L-threonylcarbamoyladenine synthase